MVKNEAAKRAIADAIGWRGSIADGPAFAEACVEFERAYPADWQRICSMIVQQFLSGKNLKV